MCFIFVKSLERLGGRRHQHVGLHRLAYSILSFCKLFSNYYSAADQIRILVATDSHVGYAERDPIRKDDAWKTFNEVMELAKTEDVDMVLLAGDLFHENKPSRKSMYKVMRSLRMNCYGEKPCELQMLSDAGAVFGGAFTHVNYEDEDINVAIPVFSIHGNHDDPSGDGHYCALDILEVAGLMNYFGRTPESDNIAVKPVLMQKGQTKLALYGLSNVRDERLFRTFRDGKVTFFKPNQQQGDWFNLMAVHQNHHAHNETGYLPENFLPEFLDLVVWGHEHECQIDPKKNPETGFHVMQPGSSVATSLVAGEMEQKHVAVVTIAGKDFKVDRFPLKTVRPFITREIKLADDKRFQRLEKLKDNKAQISRLLQEIIEEMIEEASNQWLELQDGEEELEPPKPLIRLKVETTSKEGHFEMENPHRFSNKFADKVANTNDVVHFYRKKTGTTRKAEKSDMPDQSALGHLDVNDIKVEKLVREFLEAQSLKILPQQPFGDAVHQFVEKNDKYALESFVGDALTDQVREMLSLDAGADDDDLDEAMEAKKQAMEKAFAAGLMKLRKKETKYKPKPRNWDSDLDGEWEDQPQAIAEDDDEEDEAASVVGVKAPAKKVTPKRAPAKKAPAKTTKAAAKKITAAKPAVRGRKKAVVSEEEEDEDVVMLDDDDDEEPAPVPKKPPPMRAAPARAAATRTNLRQAPLNFSQYFSQPSQAAKKVTQSLISEDEISDDDDAFAPPVSQPPSRRS